MSSGQTVMRDASFSSESNGPADLISAFMEMRVRTGNRACRKGSPSMFSDKLLGKWPVVTLEQLVYAKGRRRMGI